MSTITSKDGTTIAYDRSGEGPAVVLVDGAMGHRAQFGARLLAAALADCFTAYTYDRRGRGESSDTLPYAVEREIEDIEALIEEAGGSASLYGISSGAALAFEAARALRGKVRKLALYEPPYNDEDDARRAWRAYRKQLKKLLVADRRGSPVTLFMKFNSFFYLLGY
jgi:pimeloyl-ACP methyl ester carboxylesterase